MTSAKRPRTVRRRILATFGVLAGVALHGCGHPDGNQAPGFVQDMMKAEFPADGGVHAQMRGKFRVEPTTVFCTFRPGYGLDAGQLNAALTRIGQKSVQGGAVRTHQAGVSKECVSGRAVFIRTTVAKNRRLGPYKVTVVVWQGNAAWVGTVERLNGVRPEFESARPSRDGLPPLTPWTREGRDQEDKDYKVELSIRRDLSDLSHSVLTQIMGSSK